MTSLANQLKSLALPHTQAILGDQTKRVSLLFDPTEAANLDKEALFAIGVSGLEELIEIDSVFIEYEKSLFNESASNIQRLVQGSDVNQMLNENIKLFLIRLSPYFLLRPAQKTLEWLIYRYQVHFYNIDELLVCAFPYHDSNMFIRLLQILDFSNRKSKWHWLEPAQKQGTQLPTQTIATHVYKDEGFLNFVSSIPEQFINVYGHDRSGSGSPVHLANSFYTKIVLNSMQLQPQMKKSFIAQLVTFIIRGLKSKSDEYKCASYMVLTTICSKVSLEQTFLESVLPLLTKRMTMRNGFEAVSCIAYIYKTQPSVTSLPKKCFKHMCRLPGIVQHLTQLHEWCVLDPFWPQLIAHLVPAVIKDSRMGATSSSDGGVAGTELLKGRLEYWPLFDSLMSDCELEKEHVISMIRRMCDSYVENKQKGLTAESEALLAERVRAMLRILERKYSKVVDEEIQRRMATDANNELVEEFALMSVSSFKYQCTDEGVGLALSLYSHSHIARSKGVQLLVSLLDNKDEVKDKQFVGEALYSRLLDDEESVSDLVLENIKEEHLLEYLSAQQLVDVVRSAKRSKVVLKCWKVLSKHELTPTIIDEMVEIILVKHHLAKYKLVNSLISTSNLPLFAGSGAEQTNWKSELVKVVASNIISKGSTHSLMEKAVSGGARALFTYAMCDVFFNICKSEGSPAALRMAAASNMLTVMKRINEEIVKGSGSERSRKCLDLAVNNLSQLFVDWEGGWWTEEEVTSLLHSFLTWLMQTKRSKCFAEVVEQWLNGNTFSFCFTTMVSRGDDLLTANILSFINHLPNEVIQLLASAGDGFKVVSCVMSLLLREEKLVRKTAFKLMQKMAKNVETVRMQSLVEMVLDHSQEITTDPQQLPEILTKFWTPKRNRTTADKVLRLVCEETTPPEMARSLLICFSAFEDSSILAGILPLLERLLADGGSCTKLLYACLERYTDESAELLGYNADLWNLFIKSLSLPSCQQQSLALVTKTFYSLLPSLKMQSDILSTCLNVYLRTDNADTQVAITKLVRRVTLPASTITQQLDSLLSAGQDHSMKMKKMRRSEVALVAADMLSSPQWSRARLLLEWLQNKKKIDNVELLVPLLFKLATHVLEMTEEASSEYVKQLLLGALNNALSKLSSVSNYKELLVTDQLNMEAVVQCIRTSTNPQTHQHALLLLKTAATLYPDVVLHHVMSIFTYMGANIMRQDDTYSFQIITNTLDTVVPEIVKGSDESGIYTITGIIRVFVDAYPHIPEHRRLALFTQLLHTVGDNKYLHVCACLCAESVSTSAVIAETPDESDWKTDSNQLTFMVILFAKFSVDSQLRACSKILEFLCSLPCDISTTKSSSKRRLSPMKKGSSDGLFDVSTHTDKQLRHFKYGCAGFVVSLLSSSTFIEQFVNDDGQTDLTATFNELVEVGLRYISLVAKETSKHVQHATAKFWKALLHKAYEILDKVNNLLPSAMFIDVISSLLPSELPLIRRKALDLLNNRLPQTALSNDETSSLVDLVSTVKAIALDRQSSGEDAEDTTNRQTALYSLKIIARILAGTHGSLLLQLLEDTCRAFDEEGLHLVRANVLLLLGELISQLKVAALPQLNVAVPKLLSTLQQQELLQSNHLLWISAVMGLQKVMEAVPTFLSGYLVDILVVVCTHSSLVKSGGDVYKGYKAQLPVRLKTVRETVAKEFSPRVLVQTVIKTYSKISHDNLSVECLMTVLADHISMMSKDDLSSCHHKLLELFLLVLDYRTAHYQDVPSDVEETEDAAIKACIKMVVKLSEASFRPMYFKLCGWATRESEIGDRLITFYRLSDQIAETLRGLFSLFATHIVKNAADVLNAANSAKPDVISPFSAGPHLDVKNCLVTKAILHCLYKCFLYDAGGFVTKQRMDVLMQPLVDQLENEVVGYESYIKEHVMPCVSQLAMAAGDDALWKPLVYQICLKTRHSSPQVRKGALYVMQDLSSRLGEDFMTLLPETIPFLAELMEDDEEDVEALCQEVIANMETMLGEPLQKYF